MALPISSISSEKLCIAFPMNFLLYAFISLTRFSYALPPNNNNPFPPTLQTMRRTALVKISPSLCFLTPYFNQCFLPSPLRLLPSPLVTFSTSPHPMDQCIEQLHFDVPLISTRRVSGSANANKSSHLNSNQPDFIDTSRRVPFSWEAAPGVPKSSATRSYSCKDFTPRPPPGRWQPQNLKNIKTNNYADHDRNDANRNCGIFSNAVLEKNSSFESLGIGCRPGPSVNHAPSFIMNRFLPAANALAAASSSAANLPKYSKQRSPSSGSRERPTKLHNRLRATTADAATVPYTLAHPVSPSASCRLVDLFPWSLKLKRVMCRLKSPVRCQTPKIASVEALVQRSRRIASDVLSSDDGVSSKACKSPGWGLPFLDTSRLRMREGSVDIEEGRRLVDRKESKGRTPRRPFPVLNPPAEPWLAHALNSVNRR